MPKKSYSFGKHSLMIGHYYTSANKKWQGIRPCNFLFNPQSSKSIDFQNLRPLDLPFSCPQSEEIEGTGHGETLLPKTLLPVPTKSRLEPPESAPAGLPVIEDGVP